MKITTIGIDLAKEVFQIHGMDEHGKTVLRKQLRRSGMAKFFANLESCLIGMEACGSSHHWARKLGEFGHPSLISEWEQSYYSSSKSPHYVQDSHYGNRDNDHRRRGTKEG